MRSLKNILLAVFILASGVATAAQIKIAATVGDEAITTYEMVSRTKLIIFSSGLPQDKETFNKVLPQGLQSLISDKLVIQEANRLGVVISDDDMKNAEKSIMEKNGFAEGQMEKLMAQMGIPLASFQGQIRAQIAQAKLKQMKVRPLINISDEEVEDFVKAQSFNQEVEEYYLNEIVLPVETPEDDAKVQELANKLYSELKSGKDFAAFAREFSGSGSAYNDGKVGWMPENQIPKEILAEIKKNEIGVVSEPIRSIEGYFIVKASEKREQNSIAQEDEVNLKQFEIMYPEKTFPKKEEPVPADPKKAKTKAGKKAAAEAAAKAAAKEEAAMKEAAKVIKGLTEKLLALSYDDEACNNPETYAASNNVKFKDYGSIKIGELDPKVRPLVAELPVGEFSKPVKTPQSALVFLVCERIENIAPLVDDNKRAQAREALFARKMDLQWRKYIREIRRRTNIEIRL